MFLWHNKKWLSQKQVFVTKTVLQTKKNQYKNLFVDIIRYCRKFTRYKFMHFDGTFQIRYRKTIVLWSPDQHHHHRNQWRKSLLQQSILPTDENPTTITQHKLLPAPPTKYYHHQQQQHHHPQQHHHHQQLHNRPLLNYRQRQQVKQ